MPLAKTAQTPESLMKAEQAIKDAAKPAEKPIAKGKEKK